MKKFKLLVSVLAMSSALTACTTTLTNDLFGGSHRPSTSANQGNAGVVVTPTNTVTPYRLSANHWSDVASIRNRANELSIRVGQGELTKVQAAQLLNEYRVKLVGHNSVDDNVYTVYLRAATQSQSGQINTDQSKRLIQNALSGWSQRWPNMQNKPSNPAFTNFLNEVMGLQALK